MTVRFAEGQGPRTLRKRFALRDVLRTGESRSLAAETTLDYFSSKDALYDAMFAQGYRHSAIDDARAMALERAWQRHPERFATRPQPPQIRNEVWINQPGRRPELSTARTT